MTEKERLVEMLEATGMVESILYRQILVTEKGY